MRCDLPFRRSVCVRKLRLRGYRRYKGKFQFVVDAVDAETNTSSYTPWCSVRLQERFYWVVALKEVLQDVAQNAWVQCKVAEASINSMRELASDLTGTETVHRVMRDDQAASRGAAKKLRSPAVSDLSTVPKCIRDDEAAVRAAAKKMHSRNDEETKSTRNRWLSPGQPG